MSIAKNVDFFETAIRSAFRDTFKIGYAIDVFDVTEDISDGNEDALAFEIAAKKTIIPLV